MGGRRPEEIGRHAEAPLAHAVPRVLEGPVVAGAREDDGVLVRRAVLADRPERLLGEDGDAGVVDAGLEDLLPFVVPDGDDRAGDWPPIGEPRHPSDPAEAAQLCADGKIGDRHETDVAVAPPHARSGGVIPDERRAAPGLPYERVEVDVLHVHRVLSHLRSHLLELRVEEIDRRVVAAAVGGEVASHLGLVQRGREELVRAGVDRGDRDDARRRGVRRRRQRPGLEDRPLDAELDAGPEVVRVEVQGHGAREGLSVDVAEPGGDRDHVLLRVLERARDPPVRRLHLPALPAKRDVRHDADVRLDLLARYIVREDDAGLAPPPGALLVGCLSIAVELAHRERAVGGERERARLAEGQRSLDPVKRPVDGDVDLRVERQRRRRGDLDEGPELRLDPARVEAPGLRLRPDLDRRGPLDLRELHRLVEPQLEGRPRQEVGCPLGRRQPHGSWAGRSRRRTCSRRRAPRRPSPSCRAVR